MSEKEYHRAGRLFHLLSHPGRLRILDELRRDEACVCHLQAVTRRPQAYVSQQLRVLRKAGVVTSRREGQMVYYRLDDQDVAQLLKQILGPAEGRTSMPSCSCPKCVPKEADG